jgi:histone H3/H4
MFLMDNPNLFLKNFDLKKCKEREKSDCLYFEKKPFRELIIQTMENTNTTYRMKKGVHVLIQYHIEYFLEKILNKSKSIVDSKLKKILLPRDIQFPLLKH